MYTLKLKNVDRAALQKALEDKLDTARQEESDAKKELDSLNKVMEKLGW